MNSATVLEEDKKHHIHKHFSSWEFLKQLINKEGYLTFYKGLQSGLIGTVVSFAIYFFWYRLLKNYFYHTLKRTTLGDLDITVITLLSGVINSILSNPIWFLNTRMTVAKEKKGLLQTVKEIYKEEGIGAFYKGVLPNMALVANPVINFVIYENLKRFMLTNKYSMNTFQLLVISSFAKAIATIFTYPILTVRVKLQVKQKEGEAE